MRTFPEKHFFGHLANCGILIQGEAALVELLHNYPGEPITKILAICALQGRSLGVCLYWAEWAKDAPILELMANLLSYGFETRQLDLLLQNVEMSPCTKWPLYDDIH